MKKKSLLLIPFVFLIAFFVLLLNNNKTIKIESSNPKKLTSYSDVLDGENSIENTENVKFDAYFSVDKDNDGIADKIRGNSLKTDELGKLNININVTNEALLKNIKIEFVNSNVDVGYKSSYVSYINLDDIESGTNKDFKVTLRSNLTNDINSYNKTNKVILTGTVVENGNEINIRKEVSYIVDWYRTSLTTSINSKTSSVKTENNKIVVEYNFQVQAYDARLLKSVNLDIDVPLLNNVKATSAKVVGTNINQEYNSNNNKLTANRNAILDDTLIINSAYDYYNNNYATNSFKVVLEYPIEAGLNDATIPLNVKAWHELYNNQDSDYQNIIVSEPYSRVLVATNVSEDIITSINEQGPIPFLVGVKTSVSATKQEIDKTPVFNFYEGLDGTKTTEYGFKLVTSLYYTLGKVNKVMIFDTDYDKFDDSKSMMSFTKYKTIRFLNASTFLSEGGYIKLYDADSDELIHIFTKDDWNNVYTFEDDVRKIYIETSSIEGLNPKICRTRSECNTEFTDILTTYITKEIDNELLSTTYSKSEFENISYIKTSISTNLEAVNNTEHSQEIDDIGIDTITYRTPRSSIIILGLNKTNIPTNEEQNINLTIKTGEINDLKKGWKDGEFLVVVPKEIIDLKINSITINNDNVDIVGYELLKEEENSFIKIITSNDEPASYNITVNLDILPDPRVSNKSILFELYGLNKYFNLSDTISTDKYDLNNNNSTTDKMNYNNKTLVLDTSNEVRTITLVKVYDENNNERLVVTPNITEVDPLKDKEKAKVEISIVNNSNEKIKDIVIIGKTGYIGNTYQLNNTLLGSEFDVNITNDGISVPSEILSNTKVYYSNVQNPTNDISNVSNNWKLKEDVTDFNSIKSYMIVVEDYLLVSNKSLIFSYELSLPMDTNYLNKVSYLTHGVYYNTLTEDGIVQANPIEQRKTGIMMTRKYSLSLTNYKKNGTKTINDSTFILTDEENNTKILKTNNSGNVIINNLYVGKEYSIVQNNVKNPYILDEDVKTFKVINNNSTNILEMSNNETGIYRNISVNGDLLTIDIENDVRYDLTIKNTDIDTNALIPLSKFKVTGKGYEDGKVLVTNSNGELSLSGLYLNSEYTVEQISSVNHLQIFEPFKFYLRRNHNGEVSIAKEEELPYDFGEAIPINSTNGFNYYPYSSYGYTNYRSKSNTRNSVDEAYVTLDLTDFYDTYEFNYYVTTNDYNDNEYGYDLVVTTDTIHIPDFDEKTVSYYSGYSPTVSTAYSYNSSTNSFDQVPITGGNVYYIFMHSKHPNLNDDRSMFFSIYGPTTLDGRSIEFTTYDSKENVPVETNNNILQTIVDNDNIDAPEFTLNVKSKIIPTYTLEITKVSSDTKEPLKDAQYMLTGPGLPSNGKFIKTNEEGKATIKLNEKWFITVSNSQYSNYKQIINGFDYSKVENIYSIKEVVPPIGYQIDNKTVEFGFSKHFNDDGCTGDPYSSNYIYTCLLDNTSIYSESLSYLNIENQFVDYEFDKNTNTLKVTMYDYPLISITKKDAETGELLPDTLFAVYSVSVGAGGKEVLEPAKDSKGNVLGIQIKIDDKYYNVVSTNSNGKLNLDLTTGEYKAVEIQASNDKYELDDAYYYFNVGPTLEREEGSFGYYSSFNAEEYIPSFYGYGYNDDIISTSDGGWLLYSRYRYVIEKRDKNGNVEWSKIVHPDSLYSSYNHKVTRVHAYFDDKANTKYEKYETSGISGNYDKRISYLAESDDGYYLALHRGSVYKFDKLGNLLWENTYSVPADIVYYNALCDKNSGKLIGWEDYMNDSRFSNTSLIPYDPNNIYIQKDESTYYCHTGMLFDSITGQYGLWPDLISQETYSNSQLYRANQGLAVDSKGNVTNIIEDYTSSYKMILSDGTIKGYVQEYNFNQLCYRKVYDNINDPYSYTSDYDPENCPQNIDLFGIYDGYFDNYTLQEQKAMNSYFGYQTLVRYNKNGEPISVNNLNIYYKEALKKYNQDNGTDISFRGGFMESPSYRPNTFIYTFENDDILVYSQLNGFLRLRYDEQNRKYNIIYIIPFTEISYFPSHPNIQIEGNKFSYLKTIMGWGMLNVESYDENGVLISSFETLPTIDSIYDQYGNYSNEFWGKLNGSYITYYKYDDNNYYIFVVSHMPSGYSSDNVTVPLELETGEIFNMNFGGYDPNIFIDKIFVINTDKNGNRKWVKEYIVDQKDDDYFNGARPIPRLSSDKTKLILPVNVEANTVITNPNENKQYVANGNIFIFDIKDETKPEVPEAYSIEIQNERKTFKINVESSENGRTEIINGDNVVYNLNNESKDIENIKYGDNSIYKIRVIPNNTHSIDKVLVNDKEYPYTANEDGSIILDNIENVKENKNIKITFKLGGSKVIVHHYIKDTEEKIASDEILSGLITTSYETEPTLNELYSLIKDENGEYILPNNYKGKFDSNITVVTYYYEQNNVNLKTNYYKENTTIELAPSKTERKLLGSSYKTSPMNIEFYELVNVIGDEEGTLTKENTEVTYMYQEVSNVTLTIKYIDKDTEKELSDTITKELKRHDKYETSSIEIPLYKLVDKTDNYKGKAEKQDIEVIYYYEKIKSNITVKYLEKDTNKELSDSILITVNLNDNYITQSKVIDNYKLIDKTNNTSGKAESEEVEVIYYYEYIEQPKIIEEIEKPTPQIKNTISFIIKNTLEIENEEKEKQVLGAIEEEVGDNPLCIKIVSIIALIIIVAGVILYNKKEA